MGIRQVTIEGNGEVGFEMFPERPEGATRSSAIVGRLYFTLTAIGSLWRS